MFSDEIQKEIERHMQEQNSKAMDDFDGLSPNHMQMLLYHVFHKNSFLKFQKLSEKQYTSIPILSQAKYLANCIVNEKEVKLTKTGALPTKIVFNVYNNGGYKEEGIEQGYVKLRREADSFSVQLSNILLQLTGIVKKTKGKLSVTKKGISLINDNHKLLPLLFETFCTKFNWAYFDGYEDERWGQLGFGFSLILLHKYGNLKRKDTFYAKKYYTAFPDLQDYIPQTEHIGTNGYGAYCYRTFEHFLVAFGLITYEKKTIFDPKYVIKTKLFDAFIKVKL